jgi:hypothetical protein
MAPPWDERVFITEEGEEDTKLKGGILGSQTEIREQRSERKLAADVGRKCVGWPLGRAGRVGIEASFVEEEDAGAEGEEHDGEAGGDAEAGNGRRGTIVTAADDDVAWDDDEEFQDAAFEKP